MASVLTLRVPADFHLAHVVCSYGYFMLEPNRWSPVDEPVAGVLRRPLRTREGAPVHVRISQHGDRLRIRCDRPVAKADRPELKGQVRRMLRVDEELRGWWRAHRAAARAGFGRLFRSPTLFEDIVKTITGCNITWPATLRMNRLLCERVGSEGAFPTPAELANWRPSRLARRCGVGYRAERIVRLARDVSRGRMDLGWFDRPERTTEELYAALRTIHGIGDYAANNILQLLGRYERLPIDTETLRHFRERHGVEGDERKVAVAARRHFDRFAPYQFLVYWYELWSDYERRFGKAYSWPETTYSRLTAKGK